MLQPTATVRAIEGMVCAVDHLAAQAGISMLRAGGSAADAAVAANAVLAVTSQHQCGMGGDLLVVVSQPGEDPIALNSSGFAGAGADPDALRAEGYDAMPFRNHLSTVTVPGCVDGWLALHDRFGRLPLAEVLEPARRYALEGFPASPLLAADVANIAHLPEAGDYLESGPLRPGSIVRRPGVARTLEAIAREGRSGFYEGEFGEELLRLGNGLYSEADLQRPIAFWTPALRGSAFGRELWTMPPNSQGYLTLASAAIASGLDLPDTIDDPLWPHYLIESARQASYDRIAVLHEGADGAALLDEARLAPRRAEIRADRTAKLGDSYRGGGTIALTVVDRARMGISVLQSNASGFGSHIAVPGLRIFLHNRGMGFSLDAGHPAEYQPGRRPPHTLCPTVVTHPDGRLAGVIGTSGGDGQPQTLLQLLAMWLTGKAEPGDVLATGRWCLVNPAGGDFNTWQNNGEVAVMVEGQAPEAWLDGLSQRGHVVQAASPFHRLFGFSHLIAVEDDHLAGASEPRVRFGAAAGY